MIEHRDRIREVLLEGPPLRLAILFGSQARRRARPDSDIDIAILPVDPALSLRDEGLLITALERATGASIDLVRLDGAAPALRWRIARDGIVLLSDPPHVAPRFLAREGIEHDQRRDLDIDAMSRYRARLAAAAQDPHAMTDVGLVLLKLQRLKAQVAVARERRPSTSDVLAQDLVLRDAMALAFMVALQEAVDIAYHIVADEGWGLPDSHRAAFDTLAAHDVLSQRHANELSAATSMRNRIAHGYASVDHERLWRELPDGLRTLGEFAAAVAGWLPAPDTGA